MTRDEGDMLPRWIDYYGGQVGVENLIVLDDNSTDGSTDGLPCTVHHLPPAPWKKKWGETRKFIVNGMSQGLLYVYDVVIVTDVDEFLVPDPAKYDGLLDYLAKKADLDVIAPLALDLLHHPEVEGPLDPTRPVLSQRRFVKFDPEMCKPLVKRVPQPWMQAFHGIKAPYEVDPELFMLHLKYYDLGALEKVAEQRRAAFHNEGRGAASSAWKLGAEELIARQRRWVTVPDVDAVPEFNPMGPDLRKVVKKTPGGFHRSIGTHLVAMEKKPLRRLPERFRNVL